MYGQTAAPGSACSHMQRPLKWRVCSEQPVVNDAVNGRGCRRCASIWQSAPKKGAGAFTTRIGKPGKPRRDFMCKPKTRQLPTPWRRRIAFATNGGHSAAAFFEDDYWLAEEARMEALRRDLDAEPWRRRRGLDRGRIL